MPEKRRGYIRVNLLEKKKVRPSRLREACIRWCRPYNRWHNYPYLRNDVQQCIPQAGCTDLLHHNQRQGLAQQQIRSWPSGLLSPDSGGAWYERLG